MNEATESLLQAKGIAPTAMRILVLEWLQQQSTAISLLQLEQGFHNADRTTLYRTLKTFEEKGLVHAIHDGSEAAKYALCAEACRDGNHYDLHLHFYCYNCRQTYCLPKHRVPDVSAPQGFELKELNLTGKGICGACAGQQCN
ncbi:MAG: transcriptional repressor [Chitinophagaceae bacterium]